MIGLEILYRMKCMKQSKSIPISAYDVKIIMKWAEGHLDDVEVTEQEAIALFIRYQCLAYGYQLFCEGKLKDLSLTLDDII